MIFKLNHKSNGIATAIHSLFQASYQVEASFLNIKPSDFPPLNRQVKDFIASDSHFYGLRKKEHIIALIEMETTNSSSHIASLVVHPDYFRKGLASQLVKYVLKATNTQEITVETALHNEAATKLYQKLGFREVKQWDTAVGIRIVRFDTKTGSH